MAKIHSLPNSEHGPQQKTGRKMTSEEYEMCWNKGTKTPFSGQYNDSKDKGVYKCVCCGSILFRSDTKFDSGTGWSSFWQPAGEGNVKEKTDSSFCRIRTEVTCGKCGARLWRVFDDGPNPTGLRYCVNSLSLELEKGVTASNE
jgi:peptide-methionine (R)-S-oxide reductase